jgi:hypothetical protein
MTARAFALFVALLTFMNLLGDLVWPGFDASLWWINFRRTASMVVQIPAGGERVYFARVCHPVIGARAALTADCRPGCGSGGCGCYERNHILLAARGEPYLGGISGAVFVADLRGDVGGRARCMGAPRNRAARSFLATSGWLSGSVRNVPTRANDLLRQHGLSPAR